MKFDTNDMRYTFSGQQTISDFEGQRLVSDFKEDSRQQLGEAFNNLKDFALGNDDRYLVDAGVKEADPRIKKGSKVPLFIVGIGFGAVILGGMLGNAAVAFAAFFLLIGALGVFSLRSPDQLSGVGATGRKMNPKAGGLFMTLLGFGCAIPMFLIPFIGMTKGFMLFGVMLFLAVGIYMIANTVSEFKVRKSVYSLEIPAECVGYARNVTAEESGGEHSHTVYVVHTYPVFEYMVNGITYTAIYDQKMNGLSSDVSLGSRPIINVDPHDPESIIPHTVSKKSIASNIIIAVICLVIAVGMAILIATDAVQADDDVQTTSTSSSLSFSDIRNIYQSFKGGTVKDKEVNKVAPKGKDWYVEIVPVENMEYDGESCTVIYEDEAFKDFFVPDTGKADYIDNPGDSSLAFYTIDEDALETGKDYKVIFLQRNSEKFDYKGSHSAYEE